MVDSVVAGCAQLFNTCGAHLFLHCGHSSSSTMLSMLPTVSADCCCCCRLQERARKEVAQEAKRQKLESVPRALHRLYQ